jgi:hypothetical protein
MIKTIIGLDNFKYFLQSDPAIARKVEDVDAASIAHEPGGGAVEAGAQSRRGILQSTYLDSQHGITTKTKLVKPHFRFEN